MFIHILNEITTKTQIIKTGLYKIQEEFSDEKWLTKEFAFRIIKDNKGILLELNKNEFKLYKGCASEISVLSSMAYDYLLKFQETAKVIHNYSNPLPRVHLDLNTKAAGIAYYKQDLIRLNPVLALKDLNKYYDTVGHEYAHLVSYGAYGKDGHGKSWKYVMSTFNLKPERCHNLDTKGTGKYVSRYIYNCNCGQHLMTPQKHINIMNKKSTLLCKHCKATLSFTGKSLYEQGIKANQYIKS